MTGDCRLVFEGFSRTDETLEEVKPKNLSGRLARK